MGQNPSAQELDEMISEMDEDGSGTVDFEVGLFILKIYRVPHKRHPFLKFEKYT